ncbi:sugar transferase [Oribacterium sinus]|uniref:sugar transferase n=1 Tax=Oribacterium sinus TaxID=237576 RepID=UPI0028E4ACE8|nr:sugar transferase [Oribacterium sinus]
MSELDCDYLKHRPYGFYETILKPVLGWLFALIFVLLFWWLYILIAVLVRVKLGSPILYTQERPGKIDRRTGKEKIFKLYKFRTMLQEGENKLSDEERLTEFGKKLRSTSLDELPEILFNILLFRDMAWIGPRPLLVKYLPFYTEQERMRHAVKPGLTGLSQVSGRNYLGWDERFALDCKYVSKITFVGDIKIVFKTIKKVIMHSDITTDGKYTIKDFDEERKNGNY